MDPGPSSWTNLVRSELLSMSPMEVGNGKNRREEKLQNLRFCMSANLIYLKVLYGLCPEIAPKVVTVQEFFYSNSQKHHASNCFDSVLILFLISSSTVKRVVSVQVTLVKRAALNLAVPDEILLRPERYSGG